MDNEYVAQVANFIFDDDLEPGQVKEPITEVVASAFHEAIKASRALDLVPKPPGGKPGLIWFLSQLVRAFWNSKGRSRIYEAARQTAKRNWRSVYELAKIDS